MTGETPKEADKAVREVDKIARSMLLTMEDSARFARDIGLNVTTEDLRSVAISAHIEMFRGRGREEGGSSQGGDRRPREKDYKVYDEPMTDKQSGMMHAVERAVVDILVKDQKMRPENAVDAKNLFMKNEFKDYFGFEMPVEERGHRKLTKGQAMFLIDRLLETWPQASKREGQ